MGYVVINNSILVTEGSIVGLYNKYKEELEYGELRSITDEGVVIKCEQDIMKYVDFNDITLFSQSGNVASADGFVKVKNIRYEIGDDA